MPVRGKIEYVNSPKQTMKKMVEATKVGLEKAAAFWHRVFMPGHFTNDAKQKYNYKPRKGDDEPPRLQKYVRKNQYSPLVLTTVANWHYSWRKRRQKRHNKPLVWSGESEMQAEIQVRISSVKRRTGVIAGEAVMPLLPKYFFQYRPDLNQPDKADELTRAIPSEVTTLQEVVNRNVIRTVNAPAAPEPSVKI